MVLVVKTLLSMQEAQVQSRVRNKDPTILVAQQEKKPPKILALEWNT